jgi:uncharacterized protein (DUF488 family)
MTIHTIGHSTRPAEVFVELLHAHGLTQLADIRSFPGSRRHPQFDRAALAARLGQNGIRYRHFRELGGMRVARADSPNSAWRNRSFRGYADHMLGDEFASGVELLLAFSTAGPTAVMCAEADWRCCHRALLSDFLVVQGVAVTHVVTAETGKSHTLSEFARLERGRVIYPGLV